jgi:hypothetical protein
MKTVLVHLGLVGVVLAACSPTLVPNHGIRVAKITANPSDRLGTAVSITDERVLARLVDQINCSNEDPAVFYAVYSVRLEYAKNKEILILVNGNRLKINGLTFVNSQNIEAMLDRIVKK